MANQLTCDIITPERKVFSGECNSVTVPAFDGSLGILPGHAPFVTQLGLGIAEIASADDTGARKVKRFAVRDGFLQVVQNKVTLLAVDAIAADDPNTGPVLNDPRWNEIREKLAALAS